VGARPRAGDGANNLMMVIIMAMDLCSHNKVVVVVVVY
jgi:hypothetical protein